MSKSSIHLEPTLPANTAVKMIYLQLLHTIKHNEQGSIDASDTEFLHDFRIAVRKTRAGLSQLKAALPPKITRYYSDYFAWLGQITSNSRDLDVYLLNFEDYKNSLPGAIREDLNLLQDFLKSKQCTAQQELVAHLISEKYRNGLNAWEQYLNLREKIPTDSDGLNLTIKQLSDSRIYKLYQQVIKQGLMINNQSAAEALHDLRKTCKKLRYLIEFFQSLYPPEEIKQLIKAIKELQEVLGDFQDCVVQENSLRQFSEEMRQSNYPQQTFVATTKLLEVLATKRAKAHHDFAGHFTVFTAPQNGAIFASLFSKKAKRKPEKTVGKLCQKSQR